MRVEIWTEDDIICVLPTGGMPMEFWSYIHEYLRDEEYIYWLPSGERGEYRFCKQMTDSRRYECSKALTSGFSKDDHRQEGD
jgi:hypothetical protein